MSNPEQAHLQPIDYGFYFGTILIWGTTWIAIKFQLGIVPAELSIAYRFFCASIILFFIAGLRKRQILFSFTENIYFLLMGLCLFSCNYFLQYLAVDMIVSGLVALTFTTIILWNTFFQSLFFGIPLSIRQLIGAFIGLTGITLVFAPDVLSTELSTETVVGLTISLIAAAIASIGNMVSVRAQKRNLPVMEGNAYSMAYGALLMLLIGWIRNGELVFDFSFSYIASFIYLTLFGSVTAFGLYLTLLGRIGAVRASYNTILIPIVALLISTFFENFSFSVISGIGVVLSIVGNVIVLHNPKTTS